MTLLDRRSVAVGLAGFTNFLNLYTPQAILPALAADFAVPAARTGLTVTAPLVAVALVAPFAGTISDRLGRKRLIVAACLALCVPTLLVATASSLEIMLAWRFLQGLCLPFIFAVTVAYIGDECEGAYGLRVIGFYSVGTIIGGFGGRFVAGIATDLGGWRLGFVAVGIFTLFSSLVIATVLPRERRFRPIAGGLPATLATYRLHVADARLIATCLIGFGMLFSNVAVYTFVNFHLAAPPYSLSPAALGMVFAVYLLGVVTTAVATWLALRIGRRTTLALALGLAAVGLLLTLLPSLALAIAGLAFFSGGMFVVQALSINFIGTAVERAKSTAVGMYVTTFYTGGAIGGIAPGVLWRLGGWGGVVALVLCVFAAMMALAQRFWRLDRVGS